MEIILIRSKGPDWKFTYQNINGTYLFLKKYNCWPNPISGWLHITYNNVYKIFIEDGEWPDVWIGRWMPDSSRPCWITWEKELKAKELHFGRGIFTFNYLLNESKLKG
jgi:hypothetical protein